MKQKSAIEGWVDAIRNQEPFPHNAGKTTQEVEKQPMKASEVIIQLTTLLAVHGDCVVEARSFDESGEAVEVRPVQVGGTIFFQVYAP